MRTIEELTTSFKHYESKERFFVAYIEAGMTDQPTWFQIMDRPYTHKHEALQLVEKLMASHPANLFFVIPVKLHPEIEHACFPKPPEGTKGGPVEPNAAPEVSSGGGFDQGPGSV